jgi:hypothetical protein
LKGASGRTYLLFKGMFRHLWHDDPNLVSGPTLKSLGPIDKDSVTEKMIKYTKCQNKWEHFC